MLPETGRFGSRALSLKQVAFFGGSFDPPHCGHVDIVRYILESTGLEQVLVVPVFEPPHKSRQLVSFEHRFQMTEAAFEPLMKTKKNIEISDVESRLKPPSYTWHTLSYLKEQNPGWNIHLVIGQDMYNSIESWYNYRELLAGFPLIVLSRSEARERDQRQEGRLYFPDNPLWQMSSTQLREMLRKWHATGREALYRELQKLVPAGVLQYIKKNNLYR